MGNTRDTGFLRNFITRDGSGNVTISGNVSFSGTVSGYATESYVGTQLAALVASAPTTLDTLNELATALGNDPNFATTVTTSIGNKLSLSGGTLTGGLIGTSATFSSSVTAAGGLITKGSSFNVNNTVKFLRADGPEMAYIGWSNESANNSTWLFKSSNGNPIAFSADGLTQQMVLTVAGNVGIGTTAPTYSLDVNAPNNVRFYGNSYTSLTLATTSGTNFSITNRYTDNRLSIDATGYGEIINLMSNGRVGIGTTSPTGLLHLYTSETAFRIQSSTGGNLQLGQWDTVNNRIEGSGGRPMLITSYGQPIKLGIDGSEHIRIHTDGKVGIGTSSPTDKLDVAGEVVFGPQTEKVSIGSASLAWNRKVATGLIYDSSRFAYQFQHTGSTSSGSDYLALQVYSPGGGQVNSTALVVNGAANVGIGLASPTAKLTVKSIGEVGTFGDSFVLERNYNSAKLIRMYEQSADGYLEVRTGANDIVTKLSGYGGSPSYFLSSVGIGVTNPSHKLQVSGNIYSTDTVFGRNLKPEAFASVTAGSPSAAGIPLGYSSINITITTDNNWRTILSNINDVKGYFWVTLGDAASKDTANYMMAMTSPAYGVSNFGLVSYQDNGWNTGGFEFTTSTANGTYSLLVRCTSFYSGSGTAYETIYFLRLE